MIRMGLSLCLLIGSLAASAVETVQVLGLLTDRVVLRVDGKQHTVKLGQQSPEGVRLLALEAGIAVLTVDGVERRLGLSTGVSSAYKLPTQVEVRIPRDSSGMYKIDGTINGQRVTFLVDTGASSVALNANLARNLGLDFRYRGSKGQVATAGGLATAYAVELGQVTVGGISLSGVDAVVLEGSHPSDALLGMSFLNRLTLENQGNLMLLRKNF